MVEQDRTAKFCSALVRSALPRLSNSSESDVAENNKLNTFYGTEQNEAEQNWLHRSTLFHITGYMYNLTDTTSVQ